MGPQLVDGNLMWLHKFNLNGNTTEKGQKYGKQTDFSKRMSFLAKFWEKKSLDYGDLQRTCYIFFYRAINGKMLGPTWSAVTPGVSVDDNGCNSRGGMFWGQECFIFVKRSLDGNFQYFYGT